MIIEATQLREREENTNTMVQIVLDRLNGISAAYASKEEAIAQSSDYKTLYNFLEQIHFTGKPVPKEEDYQRPETFALTSKAEAILIGDDAKAYKQLHDKFSSFNNALAETRAQIDAINIADEARQLCLTSTLSDAVDAALTYHLSLYRDIAGDSSSVDNYEQTKSAIIQAFNDNAGIVEGGTAYVTADYVAGLKAELHKPENLKVTSGLRISWTKPLSNNFQLNTDKLRSIFTQAAAKDTTATIQVLPIHPRMGAGRPQTNPRNFSGDDAGHSWKSRTSTPVNPTHNQVIHI